MTDGFVVVVEFDLKQGRVDEFMRLVRANASASVLDEPGCRRFDVLSPETSSGGQERIVLYEIYRNPAAFEAHLQTAHFKAFQDAAAGLVVGQVVRRFNLHENAKTV